MKKWEITCKLIVYCLFFLAMPCTKYTSLTNEVYLFCTRFTSQSALWLNTDGVASFEITAGEQNNLPAYFRINISGFHLHEERKINKNHLPGTFTYFPTVQIVPMEISDNIAKHASTNLLSREVQYILNSVWVTKKKMLPSFQGSKM